MRIPKLRGFKNRFKIEYEVVNIGAIGALAEAGAFEMEGGKASSKAPVTINQDILRAVGLVRTLNKPMKILGAGELSMPLFVVADAFTGSARAKIEAAGGSVNVLEIPTASLPALGVTPDAEAPAPPAKGTAEATAEAPAEAPAEAVAPAAKPAAKAARTSAERGRDTTRDRCPRLRAEGHHPCDVFRRERRDSAGGREGDRAPGGSGVAAGSGSDSESNLISVCCACHKLVHHG
jgi:hypothetical protein